MNVPYMNAKFMKQNILQGRAGST